MKRIISVDTGSLSKLKNTYEALDYIAKAGLKHFDLSLYWFEAADRICVREDYLKEVNKLKKHADELGLQCNQSHCYWVKTLDKDEMEIGRKVISQGLRVSKLMGAKMSVLHPVWEYSIEENVKFFNSFLPLLKELDYKIAIENVYGFQNEEIKSCCTSSPESFKTLLSHLDEKYFSACLDIGHAEMKDLNTSAIEMINTLGNRIECLHIHDNDQKYDLHQIPYTYNIDFEAIFKCLKDNHYQGDITFEVERCYSHFPVEVYPEVLKLLKKLGEHFVEILDK